jgi:hypothetical protein
MTADAGARQRACRRSVLVRGGAEAGGQTGRSSSTRLMWPASGT